MPRPTSIAIICNTSYDKSLTSTTNTMYFYVSVTSLFALSLSATAVSGAPALDTTSLGEVPFTFTSWIDGMIANPNGNHLSPDEAVDAAYNGSSLQLGKRVWCDVEASHPRTNVRLLPILDKLPKTRQRQPAKICNHVHRPAMPLTALITLRACITKEFAADLPRTNTGW